MEVILGNINVLNMNIYLKQMCNILLIHFLTLSTELGNKATCEAGS